MSAKPIIFFDGVCGLCNRIVNIALAADKQKMFLFSPLQGEAASRLLDRALRENLDSVVLLLADGGVFRKSSAILRIALGLGGLYKIFAIFLIVPPFLRDGIYNLVAKNRYRIFGKSDTCRVPTLEERERFLP